MKCTGQRDQASVGNATPIGLKFKCVIIRSLQSVLGIGREKVAPTSSGRTKPNPLMCGTRGEQN